MTRRHTQGNWSLDQRYAQFAAAGVKFAGPEFYLMAVNDLYGDAGEEFLERKIHEGKRVLLDSGIFNLTNAHMRETGCTMDTALSLAPDEIEGFDRLYDRYVELASKWGDQLWGYIELDQGGAENKRITRARLHDLGLDPIPVYHPLNDGWDYFDELGQGYDRICLGNIVQASVSTRVRLLHALWERRRAYPEMWIHALGLSPSEACVAFPPDSCDSSSWLSGLRWSKVYLGSSCLKAVSRISDSDIRYLSQNNDGVPDDEMSYNMAICMYADEVEFTTHSWRRIASDRAAELGEDTRPAYDKREAALCPASK